MVKMSITDAQDKLINLETKAGVLFRASNDLDGLGAEQERAFLMDSYHATNVQIEALAHAIDVVFETTEVDV